MKVIKQQVSMLADQWVWVWNESPLHCHLTLASQSLQGYIQQQAGLFRLKCMVIVSAISYHFLHNLKSNAKAHWSFVEGAMTTINSSLQKYIIPAALYVSSYSWGGGLVSINIWLGPLPKIYSNFVNCVFVRSQDISFWRVCTNFFNVIKYWL